MICAAACSAEAYRTVAGLSFSPENGSRPRVSAAAMARATQVFPDPGSPESIANVPAASLCCQSHSTGWGWRSARQTISVPVTVASAFAGNGDGG